jgi:hypothetical protein
MTHIEQAGLQQGPDDAEGTRSRLTLGTDVCTTMEQHFLSLRYVILP